jgi:hypothetical protein
VRALPVGRVYAGGPGNWGSQYTIGRVPVYNVMENEDIDAVGWNLRTSSLMSDDEVLFDEHNPAQYDLFNIKYLLMPSDHQPAVPAQLLSTQGRHTLWSVDTSGYIEVVDTVGPAIVANRRDIGRQTASFLQSSQLAARQYAPMAFAGSQAAPPSLTSEPIPASPAGSVVSQSSAPADGSFSAVIDANRPAVVLLKVTYDPGWKVTVDGADVTPEMIAPSLVGRTVAAGRHTVVFHYTPFPYEAELLALGLVTLLGLGFGSRLLGLTKPVRLVRSGRK